jgi:hypothetical protein
MWKTIAAPLATLAAAALLAACPISQTATGGGGGPGGSDDESSGGDGGPDGTANGTGCTIPTSNGGMLCTEISLCPSLTVNQNSFAGCGFQPGGKTINLQCECSGYLCSAGTTTTCAAVEQILSTESANQVCLQLSTGGCVFEGLSGGSSTGSGSSGCNQACASTCLGDPNCTQGCGC